MKRTIFSMTLGSYLDRKHNGGRLSLAGLQSELDGMLRRGEMTAEQADDELERVTGCRFGNQATCRNPDCGHSGYPANRPA
jgi:hypothetical protein